MSFKYAMSIITDHGNFTNFGAFTNGMCEAENVVVTENAPCTVTAGPKAYLFVYNTGGLS